ncbi:hypothetical protein B5T_03103 [Alloalcanivorax dieselolei B5]|uniref:Uncharacterized protein n=1 Tax=Alcanivorax dieselolei (strain DSM 16502 / CGMCC 1.3690 / MCCC 1A00001 / B-5) TaxID=930169 RepID=K0CGA7_ALCDB|nr:hypothetical protein B5T_03103 [Alloalcanivorax dieselolei B5]
MFPFGFGASVREPEAGLLDQRWAGSAKSAIMDGDFFDLL